MRRSPRAKSATLSLEAAMHCLRAQRDALEKVEAQEVGTGFRLEKVVPTLQSVFLLSA